MEMLDYSNFRRAQGYPRKKITEMAFLLERGELTLTHLNVTKIRKRFCRPSGGFSGGEVGLETLSLTSSFFFWPVGATVLLYFSNELSQNFVRFWSYDF